MTRGRPPKSTKVLELNGAFKKNPKRKKVRENEVQPLLGDFPGFKDMQGYSQEAAFDLIVASISPGVLTPNDWIAIMEMSRILFLSWNDACTASERHLLMSMLGQFGMTPPGRVKLQLGGKEKTKNRWSDVG